MVKRRQIYSLFLFSKIFLLLPNSCCIASKPLCTKDFKPHPYFSLIPQKKFMRPKRLLHKGFRGSRQSQCLSGFQRNILKIYMRQNPFSKTFHTQFTTSISDRKLKYRSPHFTLAASLSAFACISIKFSYCVLSCA